MSDSPQHSGQPSFDFVNITRSFNPTPGTRGGEAPARLDDVIADIGEVAWLAVERGALLADFTDLAARYAASVQMVDGRLRPRRR
jgi:hypothetical protein